MEFSLKGTRSTKSYFLRCLGAGRRPLVMITFHPRVCEPYNKTCSSHIYYRNFCWLPLLQKMETCSLIRGNTTYATVICNGGWERTDQKFPFLDHFCVVSAESISDSLLQLATVAIPDVDTPRLHMPLLRRETHRDSLFITCSFPGLRPFAGRWQHHIHERGSEEGSRTERASYICIICHFALRHNMHEYARWSYCT